MSEPVIEHVRLDVPGNSQKRIKEKKKKNNMESGKQGMTKAKNVFKHIE